MRLTFSATQATVLEKLEQFLSHHSGGDDLGLRLDGEQLAMGARFLRIVKEGQYDLVIGNPPYQGTARMKESGYIAKNYPRGKADLYAAFLERGLELAKTGGMSALLTMRGWMFLGQFTELRQNLLQEHDLRSIGDVDRGAFDEVPNEVLAAVMTVVRKTCTETDSSIAVLPTPLDDRSYDRERTGRKRAAVLCQVGRHVFSPSVFGDIDGLPFVYWWGVDFTDRYKRAPKLGSMAEVRLGLSTGDNTRFCRLPWEMEKWNPAVDSPEWMPFIKGGAGAAWFEPMSQMIDWHHQGLSMRIHSGSAMRNPDFFMRFGIAFSPIGNLFSARAHRFKSIFDATGRSVFPEDIPSTLMAMNSRVSRFVMESLNPSVSFTVGDVDRIPIFPVQSANEIFATIERAFGEHESTRESSVEFRMPGPSPWQYAQAWA